MQITGYEYHCRPDVPVARSGSQAIRLEHLKIACLRVERPGGRGVQHDAARGQRYLKGEGRQVDCARIRYRECVGHLIAHRGAGLVDRTRHLDLRWRAAGIDRLRGLQRSGGIGEQDLHEPEGTIPYTRRGVLIGRIIRTGDLHWRTGDLYRRCARRRCRQLSQLGECDAEDNLLIWRVGWHRARDGDRAGR